MSHASLPSFRSFHALRIKGFATSETVAEVADLSVDEVSAHLGELQRNEFALFRENRSLWQLTPGGKAAHLEALRADVPETVASNLHNDYTVFLGINEQFKAVCADWQLYDGAPNDHMDDEYDAAVLARLGAIDDAAQPIVASMGTVLDRLTPYGRRLTGARHRLVDGNVKMLTGVMCNSYHDIWMELHEDLLLTQRIDRTAEGSF
jgi:hypothetical protein